MLKVTELVSSGTDKPRSTPVRKPEHSIHQDMLELAVYVHTQAQAHSIPLVKHNQNNC